KELAYSNRSKNFHPIDKSLARSVKRFKQSDAYRSPPRQVVAKFPEAVCKFLTRPEDMTKG
ncbi:MAG: hypothetical protein QW544_04215, partial [Candidatus Caldarchaeum sp.]